MKKTMLSFISLLLIFTNQVYSDKVGLAIVATGKYISFVPPLIESARKHFCTNHDVTYFVFTDACLRGRDLYLLGDSRRFKGNDIIVIHQKRLGWPYDTMMRFEIYASQEEQLKKMDYVFALDADMRFVAEVGDEILSDRVATLHPGFVGTRGTYETRSDSTASIGPHEGQYYFAGGFYGGSSTEFLKLVRTCSANINKDLKNKVIAIWHDESHLNRYFIDNRPTKILTPSYCYPESWGLPYTKRLLALDKNHSEMRN